MYMVVRTWANAGALADAMLQQQEDVAKIIGSVPGFVSYYATRSGDTLSTVTICESQAGVQESTKRAGEWVKSNLVGTSIEAPQIAEGETFLRF
ncbi:MAG: hypothetical protein AB7V46_02695 [Thermomicrobiales bacterium]